MRRACSSTHALCIRPSSSPDTPLRSPRLHRCTAAHAGGLLEAKPCSKHPSQKSAKALVFHQRTRGEYERTQISCADGLNSTVTSSRHAHPALQLIRTMPHDLTHTQMVSHTTPVPLPTLTGPRSANRTTPIVGCGLHRRRHRLTARWPPGPSDQTRRQCTRSYRHRPLLSP